MKFKQIPKRVIIAFIIMVSFISLLGVIKINASKINTHYPLTEVSYKNYKFVINNKLNSIERIDGNIYNTARIICKDVKSKGLLIFGTRLFFINNANKLCSTNFDGSNTVQLQKCNEAMMDKMYFVVGKHLYYYNQKGILFSINSYGNECLLGKY